MPAGVVTPFRSPRRRALSSPGSPRPCAVITPSPGLLASPPVRAGGPLECSHPLSTEVEAHGAEIYSRMCVVCHGAAGEGYKGSRQRPAIAPPRLPRPRPTPSCATPSPTGARGPRCRRGGSSAAGRWSAPTWTRWWPSCGRGSEPARQASTSGLHGEHAPGAGRLHAELRPLPRRPRRRRDRDPHRRRGLPRERRGRLPEVRHHARPVRHRHERARPDPRRPGASRTCSPRPGAGRRRCAAPGARAREGPPLPRSACAGSTRKARPRGFKLSTPGRRRRTWSRPSSTAGRRWLLDARAPSDYSREHTAGVSVPYDPRSLLRSSPKDVRGWCATVRARTPSRDSSPPSSRRRGHRGHSARRRSRCLEGSRLRGAHGARPVMTPGARRRPRCSRRCSWRSSAQCSPCVCSRQRLPRRPLRRRRLRRAPAPAPETQLDDKRPEIRVAISTPKATRSPGRVRSRGELPPYRLFNDVKTGTPAGAFSFARGRVLYVLAG